eukprot:scaffold96642_cov54-Phaeocystis_antarctica.AAC.1
MRPLYLMASTPHGFSLPPASTTSTASTTAAAITAITATSSTDADLDAIVSGLEPPSRAQLLEEVLLRVAVEEEA